MTMRPTEMLENEHGFIQKVVAAADDHSSKW